jgi:nucleotide-binding universal stress UspA family protein
MLAGMPDRDPVFVVGYDASAGSNAALAHAAFLAGGGRIVVVHAHEPAPKQLDERWREILAADQESRSQAVLDALPAAIAAALGDITWETRSVDGPPAKALCRVADEVDADAIVVGTHGAGLLQAMLGSVARALVQESARPIVVIPPHAVERFSAEHA